MFWIILECHWFSRAIYLFTFNNKIFSFRILSIHSRHSWEVLLVSTTVYILCCTTLEFYTAISLSTRSKLESVHAPGLLDNETNFSQRQQQRQFLAESTIFYIDFFSFQKFKISIPGIKIEFDCATVFRIRPCGTIFSSVDSLTCRLSVSKVKFPQM